MFVYLQFIIRLICTKGQFFSYPPLKKARLLQKYKLFFEAGRLYTKLGCYEQALSCFKHCQAYRHTMYIYSKLGLYSHAIEIAQNCGYYKEGAKLCTKIHNLKKAAYFYRYFNPLQAAKLYKRQGFFFEAGQCYLDLHHFTAALETFNLCQDSQHRQKGRRQVEEIAITLYFVKAYQEASELFLKLGDLDSAELCLQKLKKASRLQKFWECYHAA